jgi:folate-binding protein YgfZ
VAAIDTSSLSAAYGELRHGCALIDRSQRGRLALTGASAVEFLNGQVTNELGDLRDGDGRYAAFLTHKGKMLGDLRILAVGEAPGSAPRELLLDTERVALQALFDMIRRFKVGYEVQLHKRTLECAQLSLIGPRTPAVLEAAAGEPLELPVQEHSHVASAIAARPVRLIATAQPAGIDVLCAAGDRDTIERALLEAGAVTVGEECAEIARVEAGRPRYGVDLDQTVIPQEAGLNERAVSFTKGCYVGQETVARLHYRGKPNRHLRGLRLFAPQPPGAELSLEGRAVGRLTSSVTSPALGAIGLALVRREAEPGATVTVGADGAGARVVALPFADEEGA